MKYLVFDTETTGLPEMVAYGKYFPYTDTKKYNSSRLVSISWMVYNYREQITKRYFIINPSGFTIDNTSKAVEINGITQEIASTEGHSIHKVLLILQKDIQENNITTLVAHNLQFDWHILLSEIYRIDSNDNECIKNASVTSKLLMLIPSLTKHCTMRLGAGDVKIPHRYSRPGWKYPSLQELYTHFFKKGFDNAHNAEADTLACNACYQQILGLNKDSVYSKE